MKTKRIFFTTAVLFAIVSLISCNKNNTLAHVPMAGLMAFNLAPDQNNIGFTASGSTITSTPLPYSNYTGAYLNFTPGITSISAFDYGSNNVLGISSLNAIDSGYYSVFLVGSNGAYQTVVVRDYFDSLSATSGLAYIRYVNAVIDSGAKANVTISSGSNNVLDSTSALGIVSTFKGVSPGNITVNVNSASDAPLANRTISLTQGDVYTILLIGETGVTDTTRAVQVKYVINGKLTP
jgi:Domain of unknown function (DUF4397)